MLALLFMLVGAVVAVAFVVTSILQGISYVSGYSVGEVMHTIGLIILGFWIGAMAVLYTHELEEKDNE